MDEQRDVGMVSCKLVTQDGSLDLACRRAFPSLWDGFCRASGLSQWFPKSRLLAGYNLTYLDEHKTCEVDAVNGAFMFTRREAVEEVGLLDEDYFMYCEDLDWCFRFGRSGWKVVYHPAATTVHLKGQSGNPKSSAMIRELFRSTKMFYRKNCFAGMGPIRRASVLIGLDIWKWATLLRNALRTNKRTRP
jgi:N-acetylglucosaminyl-diphospho-decaprenol L-rhamnosyltransferase